MLERVAAIKTALGLPTEVVGALPIVAAANIAMGIQPDECIERGLYLYLLATAHWHSILLASRKAESGSEILMWGSLNGGSKL